MIELSDFIDSTLFDIALGVHKAKLRTKDFTAIVPPVIDEKHVSEVTHVEFDIAVKTSSSSTNEKGGGGKVAAKAKIFVADAEMSLSGDGKRSSGLSDEKTHRIAFKVPIYLASHFRNAGPMDPSAEVLAAAEAAQSVA